MAVKLQMFGGETCHVHVKVDHTGQQTKITYRYAARVQTLSGLKKLSWATRICSFS